MNSHDVKAINQFAIKSLDKMWCSEQLLFTQVYSPDLKDNTESINKTNKRYTAICLIGLKKAELNKYKLLVTKFL